MASATFYEILLPGFARIKVTMRAAMIIHQRIKVGAA